MVLYEWQSFLQLKQKVLFFLNKVDFEIYSTLLMSPLTTALCQTVAYLFIKTSPTVKNEGD